MSIDPATTIWFSSPASAWDEALPVGNGRLGAMVFGTIEEERIQLNEETYWSGGPYSTVVKGGAEALAEVQRLVFAEKFFEAHKLFGRSLMGYPVEQQKYQSLANLHLFFDHNALATHYQRWLDLETSITSVSYTVGGVRYLREVFSSAPDQAIVVRLSADQPAAVSFTANLRGCRCQAHSNYATDYFRMDPVGSDGLLVTCKSADYLGIAGKLKAEGRLRASVEGGSVRTSGIDLIVEGADAVTLVFVAATNFVNYKDVCADQHQRVEDYLTRLKGKSYEDLRQAAVQDYKKLFDRVELKLPVTADSVLPTNLRKEKIQTEPDPSLAALVYNFGRYVLISSSRPGTQATNLQGIWNDDMSPMWDSKYTTNINTEMNYWLAETANLGELTEPLFNLVREVSDQGAEVAKEHYGARGWVFHQNTDLWRVAAPMDGPSWGTFTVGGAWLCTHIWEHYLYTQDKEFLRENLSLIEGSIQFFLDFLVKHPNGKWLVTNPSTSPENFPDGGGNKPFFDETTGSVLQGTQICAGSSIDMQILHDLFSSYLQAVEELGISSPMVAKVREARDQLVPPQIGASGALQEWTEDWKSLEEKHRHFSHLYGLYPGRMLWDKLTPELIKACKNVLEERGDGGAGWSMAWKMALWARLGDGRRAEKIFRGYLKDQNCAQLFAKCGRAMQVDGTLGAAAAISEMLMQSHEGIIRLLPALPDEWVSGEFKGVCARGGFELDFKWAECRVSEVKILSKAGEVCRIFMGWPVRVECQGKAVRVKGVSDRVYEFPTSKGDFYTLVLE
jgi:alpha-L-fucosidase 2